MNFYTSKIKLFLIQIFLILLMILFLMLPTAIGVILLLFFAFLIIMTLPDLFISEPVVKFDRKGIQTSNKRNNRFGLILWNDIVEIRVASFKLNHFLIIKVKNPEEYRARVIADKGALLALLFQDPSPYISLSFALLTPSLDKALQYIKSNHPDKFKSESAKT